MTHHIKINELALTLVNKIIKNKDNYKTDIIQYDNGATVLDMTNSSWNGGKLVGEICMGGLGTVDFTSYKLDKHFIPSVNVHTSYPVISCMASQLAGWNVKLKKEVEKDGEIKKKKFLNRWVQDQLEQKAKLRSYLMKLIIMMNLTVPLSSLKLQNYQLKK